MEDFIPIPPQANRNYRSNRGRGRGRSNPHNRNQRPGRNPPRRNPRNPQSNNTHPPLTNPLSLEESSPTTTPPSTPHLRIAIEGCCHGTLNTIYSILQSYTTQTSNPIDLLLICGDFQSLRNAHDLSHIAVPPKYKSMGDFHTYYSQQSRAPFLTVFIGGNHENSAYLQELPYGGWVAPNIYYLGRAGCIQFGGVRIAGISGIYKQWDYSKGHFERPPYNSNTLRSVYHVRNDDVYRLSCLSSRNKNIDIMMSHDWPRGIEQYGDVRGLLRKKKYFRKEVEENALGSPVNEELLMGLKPERWVSAHLHVKFEATVVHDDENDDDDDVDETSKKTTRFLSLDKCLPHRNFLQVITVPRTTDESLRLEYDLEWLAVLYKTHSLTRNCHTNVTVPPEPVRVTLQEQEEMRSKFNDDLTIPENFEMTVPPYGEESTSKVGIAMVGNPQTDRFLERMELDHVVTVPYSRKEVEDGDSFPNQQSAVDKDEIDLEEENGDEVDDAKMTTTDEFEIDIDGHDEDDQDLKAEPETQAIDELDENDTQIKKQRTGSR